MYLIPDYTMKSFNMELNNDIIDCFTEKKVEQRSEKNIEVFKSDSMESYHKEDILKINQQKLITHVNEQSKIIQSNNVKANTKGQTVFRY